MNRKPDIATQTYRVTDRGYRFLMRGLTAKEAGRMSRRVSLEKMLAMAIEEEKYAVAALIRDRLGELE